MSLGPTAARKRTRDLAEYLRSGAPKGTDVLDVAAREVAPILGTEQILAARLDVTAGIVSVTSLRSPFPGAARVERALGAQLENGAWNSPSFDPAAPAPAQRNVVLSLAEIQRTTGRSLLGSPLGELLRQNGFTLHGMIRSLLCDGPSLLAWFGAFRDRPFNEGERVLLGRIARPLRDRLTLQARLESTPWVSAAMHAVLDSIGAAALVLRRPMRLLHCNAPAKALLATDRPGLVAGLREALAGRGDGGWIIQPLRDIQGPEHFLAMRRLSPCDPAPRVASATTRMGLTVRQAAVLKLVAQGQSNRVIATSLSCSESAVEQHVSALLARYDVASRAELVARFWTDSVP